MGTETVSAIHRTNQSRWTGSLNAALIDGRQKWVES